MENMGDYHDHYLKKRFIVLVDVFERFFEAYLKFYGLDPCHYFSSPWLSKYVNDYDPKKPSKFITYLDMYNILLMVDLTS